MELPPAKDLFYFQTNRPDADTEDLAGERTFFFATEILDDPKDIRVFLNEFIEWRKRQNPRITKNDLRIMITRLTEDLNREITISFGTNSMRKTLADVWRDAMNEYPSLKL